MEFLALKKLATDPLQALAYSYWKTIDNVFLGRGTFYKFAADGENHKPDSLRYFMDPVNNSAMR